MSCILLTGGSGYIGSHIASLLAREDKDFVIIDNFINSKKSVIKRLEDTSNKKINFVECDIRNTKKLIKILKEKKISAVIHLAAKKSVEESILNPLEYYDVNVSGTLSLLNAMKTVGVKNLVFSSSATIYGEPEYLPIDEEHPINAINPYGESKIIVENILSDLIKSDKEWSIVSLRYFNPIGAHFCGLLGDDPKNIKSANLLPVIIEVAQGKRECLKIFGNDYSTLDGTGIRDYIHIMDLASAHIKAFDFIKNAKGLYVFNLGTGKGVSVMELINCFEKVSKIKIPKIIVNRRLGDVGSCFANPSKAYELLNWRTKYSLEDMCQTAWNFSKTNKLIK